MILNKLFFNLFSKKGLRPHPPVFFSKKTFTPIYFKNISWPPCRWFWPRYPIRTLHPFFSKNLFVHFSEKNSSPLFFSKTFLRPLVNGSGSGPGIPSELFTPIFSKKTLRPYFFQKHFFAPLSMVWPGYPNDDPGIFPTVIVRGEVNFRNFDFLLGISIYHDPPPKF